MVAPWTRTRHQDIADRAASSYTKEFLFHQSNNDRQLLQMVDGALERLREGEFGECIACGKEINAKRLEAVPGPATALSVRKSWNREFWKRARASSEARCGSDPGPCPTPLTSILVFGTSRVRTKSHHQELRAKLKDPTSEIQGQVKCGGQECSAPHFRIVLDSMRSIHSANLSRRDVRARRNSSSS